MILSNRWTTPITALLLAGMLLACGGGGDNATPAPSNVTLTPPAPGPSAVPASLGNTDTAIALDGKNWINYRRAQVGVPELLTNARIDQAAQGHSDYQKINGITHVQIAGKSGFTGVNLDDEPGGEPGRLSAAGYALIRSYAIGEVISAIPFPAISDRSGFIMAEELITAIYHRFAIFEPMYKEIGTGAATTQGSYTYFTSNFAASNGFGPGLTRGTIVFYPTRDQTGLPTNFFSNQEQPDPVSPQDEVGYPISVHANINAVLTVRNFSVRPRGGAADLAVKPLTTANDQHTPLSAAAIIPLDVLSRNTTYDVAFTGTIDTVPVTRNWSFTTR